MDNYLIIIKQIDNTIQTNGIPYYIKKWKKIPIPDNFNDYNNFIIFLKKYVNAYHFHTHIKSEQLYNKIQKKYMKQNKIKERPMPTFKFDKTNKIGMITFYYFYNSYDEQINIKDTNKIIKLVHNYYIKWHDMNGLIIDLRNHEGGNMWPHVKSLIDILGNTTLLSFNNVKTKRTDKKWINIRNGMMYYDQEFMSNKLAFNNKIAVIVSDKTISSGEFITSIFYGRKNVKIFGDKVKKTGGYFSANGSIKINDDITLHFTSSLCTTVNGTFHKDEIIYVDKMTHKPITEAKKWILKKT